MSDVKKSKNEIMKDTAGHLGLSYSLVYSVVNNNSSVSADTRALVEKELKERGFYELYGRDASERKKKLTVLVAIPSVVNHFWDKAAEGINDALREFDDQDIILKFVRFSGFRTESETLRIIDFIDTVSPDACILSPFLSEKVKERLTALSKKTYVGIIDEPVEFEGCVISATGDYEDESRTAAEIMLRLPVEEKKILIINLFECSSQRVELFKKNVSEYSNVEISNTIFFPEYSPSLSSEIARAISPLKGTFNIIYSATGISTPICTAINKLGLQDSVFLVAHDPSLAAERYYKTKLKGAIIRQDIYSQGYKAMHGMLSFLLTGELKCPAVSKAGHSVYIYI